MDVLVTCKYEEDPIKNEGARVDTTLYRVLIKFEDIAELLITSELMFIQS